MIVITIQRAHYMKANLNKTLLLAQVLYSIIPKKANTPMTAANIQ